LTSTSAPQRELLSPCHNAPIWASLADGVMVGSCSSDGCDTNVVRLNPRTLLQEWLDGNSPWTQYELRPVADEHQNPATLAFLPVFDLRSPCHDRPIVLQDHMGRVQVGVCTECNNSFARLNPTTHRVERVTQDSEVFSPARLPEFDEAFQPRIIWNAPHTDRE
jgi:hypothetical protein